MHAPGAAGLEFTYNSKDGEQGYPGNLNATATYWLTADNALDEAAKLTHNDRFVELPGYKTFTSHYHMAAAVHAMEEQKKGINRTEPPEYVGVIVTTHSRPAGASGARCRALTPDHSRFR